jgi:hypothetical protein
MLRARQAGPPDDSRFILPSQLTSGRTRTGSADTDATQPSFQCVLHGCPPARTGAQIGGYSCAVNGALGDQLIRVPPCGSSCFRRITMHSAEHGEHPDLAADRAGGLMRSGARGRERVYQRARAALFLSDRPDQVAEAAMADDERATRILRSSSRTRMTAISTGGAMAAAGTPARLSGALACPIR